MSFKCSLSVMKKIIKHSPSAVYVLTCFSQDLHDLNLSILIVVFPYQIIERILEFSKHQIMDVMSAYDPSYRALHRPSENGAPEGRHCTFIQLFLSLLLTCHSPTCFSFSPENC